MYEAVEFSIQGVVPTIMHNGQTSDPLNYYAKEIKKLTSNKTKTDDIQMKIAELEWFAALYVDHRNRPCWPGENIESMLVAAAKKTKSGVQAKSGLLVDGNFPILHDGPMSADVIWKHKPFEKNPYISRVPVVVNRNRVMRTRPMFNDWRLDFRVYFLPNILTTEQVQGFVSTAGMMVGLSDWRPKYGRFHVTKTVHIKNPKMEKTHTEETSVTEDTSVAEEVLV